MKMIQSEWKGSNLGYNSPELNLIKYIWIEDIFFVSLYVGQNHTGKGKNHLTVAKTKLLFCISDLTRPEFKISTRHFPNAGKNILMHKRFRILHHVNVQKHTKINDYKVNRHFIFV